MTEIFLSRNGQSGHYSTSQDLADEFGVDLLPNLGATLLLTVHGLEIDADGWNNWKNVRVTGDDGLTPLVLRNFVHVDVDYGAATTGIDLSVENAKRGNILMGSGDDTLSLTLATNNSGWSNLFEIDMGAGNDNVTIAQGVAQTIGMGATTAATVIDGRFTTVEASLGDGDDFYANGTQATDIVSDGAGNDVIRTGSGDDLLVLNDSNEFGNNGKHWDNILDLGAGHDVIDATGAVEGVTINDLIFLKANAEEFLGSAWDDTVKAFRVSHDVTFYGYGGNDTFSAGSGNDYANGGEGNDTLTGGAGLNTLIGGNGNDTFHNVDDNDVVQGGAGTDLVRWFNSLSISDFHMDSNSIERAITGSGTYKLRAIYSATAVDIISYGTTTAQGSKYNDSMKGLTNSTNDFNGRDGNDTLIGWNNSDKLSGGSGDDTLQGGAGDDIIADGDGADRIQAGAGNDTINLNDNDNLILDGGSGFDFVNATWAKEGVEIDLAASNLEQARGSSFDDVLDASALTGDVELQGRNGDDVLIGGTADDNLQGGAGNDTLDGGDGDDSIVDTDGDNTLTGGNGADLFRVHANGDGTTTITDLNFSEGDVISSYGLYGTGGFRTYGSLSDFLIANAANGYAMQGTNDGFIVKYSPDYSLNVRLEAPAGLNVVDAAVQSGFVSTGPADLVLGTAGADTVTTTHGSDWFFGAGGNDNFNGYQNGDVLLGQQGNDTLSGGGGGSTGLDILIGGDGADLLKSGQSEALMLGGAGSDRFDFTELNPGRTSHVLDFEDGVDSLRVRYDNGSNWGYATITSDAAALAFANSQGGIDYDAITNGFRLSVDCVRFDGEFIFDTTIDVLFSA